jgi:hypothetical protein
MTRTGIIFVAISSLFVCSAGSTQAAVDIGVFAGADSGGARHSMHPHSDGESSSGGQASCLANATSAAISWR